MTYVCEECREEISPEATTCPHCGKQGAEVSKALATGVFLLGGLLTFTIIGAIVGLPMMWWSLRKVRAVDDASPAVEV